MKEFSASWRIGSSRARAMIIAPVRSSPIPRTNPNGRPSNGGVGTPIGDGAKRFR
jgi:hypothetical protein